MQQWREKIQKINFKKLIVSFFAAAVVLIVASGVTMAVNFGPRIQDWKTTREQQEAAKGQEVQQQEQSRQEQTQQEDSKSENDKENGSFSKGEEEGGWQEGRDDRYHGEEIENIIDLTQTDKILVGIVMVVFIVLFCAYWVIVVIGTLRMSYRYGTDALVWGVFALFFNLLAVAALYLYALTRLKCPHCGKLHKRDTQYCSRCGEAFIQTCENCGSQIVAGTVYCTVCGRKLKSDEDTSEK